MFKKLVIVYYICLLFLYGYNLGHQEIIKLLSIERKNLLSMNEVQLEIKSRSIHVPEAIFQYVKISYSNKSYIEIYDFSNAIPLVNYILFYVGAYSNIKKIHIIIYLFILTLMF